MIYLERPAPAPLDRFVRCLWVMEDDGHAGGRERIVPDGCPEIVVHYRDPFRRVPADGRAVTQHRAAVVGQIRGPIEVEPVGAVGLLGVRFRPGGGRAILGAPMAELTGESVDLTDLWGRAGREAADRISAAGSVEDRLAAATAALLPRAEAARRTSRDVEAAVAEILASGGTARVDEVAGAAGLSPRQLERRFREDVGLGPKELARIARFTRALVLLRAAPRGGFASAALAAGYYDQAHMNRDFRRLAGVSPGEYLAAGPALADVFYGP